MPLGGAELFALPFTETGIAESLAGEIPLVDLASSLPWPLVVLRDGRIPRDGRPGASYRQVFAANVSPLPSLPAPAIAATLAFFPARAPGRTNVARFAQVLAFWPVPILTPGYGPAGAATFAVSLEDGGRVTYSWQTDIIKAWSGLEQRIAVLGAPRQRYEFTTIPNDAKTRVTLSSLVANAAQGQPFLLGLTYEALTISADGSGTLIPVWSTTNADWIVAGQRIVVVSRDGATSLGAVLQSSTPTSITVDVDVSSVAKNGASIMPAVAVFLDARQPFSRYPVNAGRWDIKARATRFGFANSMTMGVGATVNTYASMPIWDRGNVVKATVNQPLDSGVALVDLGGVVADVGSFAVADWGRQLRLESERQADFQWLKAFLSTVRGMQVAFLAPTGRPDLTPVGDASSGTLKVNADAQYVTTWFTSFAHRRLLLKMNDGTIVYRTVSTAVDNGDGTQSLGLDSAAAGTIAMVSFLETCRFESDDVSIAWDGTVMSCDLAARVVQQ